MTGSFDSQRRKTGSTGGGSGGGYDGSLCRWTERELTQGIIGRRRGHEWRQRVFRVLYNWLLWWSRRCRGLGRGSAYIVRPYLSSDALSSTEVKYSKYLLYEYSR